MRGPRCATCRWRPSTQASGAHGLAGLPPHIGPEARLLLVGEAVGAVRHVVEGETLHEEPAFQQARLGVFQDPHGRIEVGDDLERAEHWPIAFLQAPGTGRQRSGILRAHGACPNHVEVPRWEGSAEVPTQDIAADAGLELSFEVQGSHFPAAGLAEGAANGARPVEQLQQPRHRFPQRAWRPATSPQRGPRTSRPAGNSEPGSPAGRRPA